VRIGDIGNLMVRFAGCCRPLPGDGIRGFVTRGRGITIHRVDCANLSASDRDRQIEITWDIGRGMKTRAGLKITTEGAPGMLAKLTQFISSRGVNVTAARSEKQGDGSALNLFTFEISSTTELLGLIRSLEKIGGVKTIERV
jgi:GTP pyrophosphokinase